MKYFRLTFFLCRLVMAGCFVPNYSVADVPVNYQLECQFQQAAKEILVELRSDNVKSVGVLKFSIRTGEDGGFPSSLGSLNMRLAEKLELALVMANPAAESQVANQVGVIRGASDIAAIIPGASHTNPKGQKLLFTKEYPLAWALQGKSLTTPDAMLVGVAQISDDLRSVDIDISMLKKGTAGLRILKQFTVATDIEDLIDSGESFATRGIFDDGKVNDGKVNDSGKTVELVTKKSLIIRTETLGKKQPQVVQQHPLAAKSNAPLKFEIYYNGQLQSYEFREGAAFMREPLAGQKVSFIVRRNDNDQKRLGVLVRVNGENTLYRERLPDSRSTVWIMEPNMKEFSVQGFQRDATPIMSASIRYYNAQSAR